MSSKLKSVEVMDDYSYGASQLKNGRPTVLLAPSRLKGHLMVWGCMPYDGVGPLITIEGSVTGIKHRQILQKHFFPLVADRRRRRLDTILQDDNAPIH